MKTTKIIILVAFVALAWGCAHNSKTTEAVPNEVTMTKERLMDKIKGGWAGQTIGCTYGGPTEFVYSTIINDNVPIKWPDHRIQWYYDHAPGLYDDIYMCLRKRALTLRLNPSPKPFPLPHIPSGTQTRTPGTTSSRESCRRNRGSG